MTVTDENKKEDGNQDRGSGASPAALLVIAVVLIAIYVVILFVLFQDADDKDVSETIWGRYTYLLGGLEAIVFTAVGWLFGREVNRKQAEQAESAQKQASAAKDEATEAKKKGEHLRGAILGQAPSGQESVGGGLGRLRQMAEETTF